MKVHAVEEKKQKGASRPEWVSELLLKKETLKHPCGGNAGQEDQTVSCSSLPYLQGRRNRGGGQGRGGGHCVLNGVLRGHFLGIKMQWY